jgi:hypothetical protein
MKKMNIELARKIIKHESWSDWIQSLIEKRGLRETYIDLNRKTVGFIDGWESRQAEIDRLKNALKRAPCHCNPAEDYECSRCAALKGI